MNVNLPPFNDEGVRQALNYAIDRDGLSASSAALSSPCRLAKFCRQASRGMRQPHLHQESGHEMVGA